MRGIQLITLLVYGAFSCAVLQIEAGLAVKIALISGMWLAMPIVKE